jgi:hypothetical protein
MGDGRAIGRGAVVRHQRAAALPRRNRTYLEGRVTSTAPAALEALAFDPQTSGGLLAAVAPGVMDDLEGFTMVGTVEAGGPGVRLT